MPRAQLTAEELELMRNRLASAALDLYRREGLAAVSFRRLAEVEGISHTLPYRYFDNKEALLARMRIDALSRFGALIRQREAGADGPLTRVHAVASAYVEFATANPSDYLLIFATHQPAPGAFPELLQARQAVFDHACGVLQDCIDAGVFPGNALELAHELWVCLHGLMSLHAANQLVHGRALEDLVEPLLNRLLGVSLESSTRGAGGRPVRPARRVTRRDLHTGGARPAGSPAKPGRHR